MHCLYDIRSLVFDLTVGGGGAYVWGGGAYRGISHLLTGVYIYVQVVDHGRKSGGRGGGGAHSVRGDV